MDVILVTADMEMQSGPRALKCPIRFKQKKKKKQ